MAETGFARPTLSDLIEQVRTDLLARLSQDEVLRRSDLEVQARVQAAALHTLYGFVTYLARQILPDTADSDWLDRHAGLWGVARKAASYAAGTATIAAATGVTIPSGTLLQRAGLGDYTVTADAVAAAGVATVSVEAAAAGAAYNLTAGSRLTLVSPVTGAQSTATVVSLGGGADIEADDALLARLLARIQMPPHGGNANDYKAWALEVSGVTRAWVYRYHGGLGTVGLTFVCDGRDDVIPTATEVAAMQTHLDVLRPVTAELIVFAPVPVPLPLTIRLDPSTAATRAAVLAELKDFFAREAEPGGVIYLSRLREAISSSSGEYRHDLLAPAADVVSPIGRLSVLGSVTWA